jgi:hypothetical protein
VAENNLKIDVSVKDLDVPLLIFVGSAGQTEVYRFGKKVSDLRSVIFKAELGSIPTIILEQYVSKDMLCRKSGPVDVTTLCSKSREYK